MGTKDLNVYNITEKELKKHADKASEILENIVKEVKEFTEQGEFQQILLSTLIQLLFDLLTKMNKKYAFEILGSLLQGG